MIPIWHVASSNEPLMNLYENSSNYSPRLKLGPASRDHKFLIGLHNFT